MRILLLLTAASCLLPTASADAQGRGRGHGRPDSEQDAAFHAMQRGQILPLNVILSRVRVSNARFIGADLDSSGSVYRLTFIGAGGNVVRLHVDARTGRSLGFSR
ncbi:PepSY domain-containing protein [Allosphingosinicella sp.]|jgi:hypothetical protein|uniref:PepSY domain-containing protein n=1 Tax=Allosphingosinicella sp. TaxID=2823234 RepID=UPI002F161048